MCKKTIIFSAVAAALIFSGCHEAKSDTLPETGIENPETSDTDQPNGTEYTVSSPEELKSLKLRPGDTIVWKNGTYDAVVIKFKANGTEKAPVTFRAETPGKVVFTGASSMSLSGSHIVAEGFSWTELDTSSKSSVMTLAKGSTHCTFTDCSIDGTGSKVSSTDSKWVSMYGTYNEVSHCNFLNKRNIGCLLVVWMEDGIVPHHVIRDNYFTRPYTHYDENGSAINGQETIRIGTSGYSMSEAGCTVSGNHFYQCHGERAEIVSNKSCGNLYAGNLFEESAGSLTLRHGNRCTVRGNYFISGGKADAGGVRVIGENHTVEDNVFLNLTGSGYRSALCLVRGESDAELSGYWTVKNAAVRGNVFVNCRYGIVVNYSGRDSQDSCPENALFEDNVLFSKNKSSYTPVYVLDTPESEMHWLNNIIYGGKCRGIELSMSDTEPQIKDYTSDMEQIRENAGKRW